MLYLPPDGLHGIYDDAYCSSVELFETLLRVYIRAGKPTTETRVTVVPSDDLCVIVLQLVDNYSIIFYVHHDICSVYRTKTKTLIAKFIK